MRLLIGLFEIQIFNEHSLEILLIVIASSTKIWVPEICIFHCPRTRFQGLCVKTHRIRFYDNVSFHLYNTLREKNILQPKENLKAQSHF